MFKTIFFVIFGICGLLADSPPNSINPQIEEILSQISAENIANIQKKLESFGTRNIYSATDDPSHGIGAAFVADCGSETGICATRPRATGSDRTGSTYAVFSANSRCS